MTSPLIAKVSAALRKVAIAEWPDTADVVVIEGYPDDLAQVAVDACCVGEMVEALNAIASWHEGSVVGGHFDEPGSAQTARDALAKLDGNLAELKPLADEAALIREMARIQFEENLVRCDIPRMGIRTATWDELGELQDRYVKAMEAAFAVIRPYLLLPQVMEVK